MQPCLICFPFFDFFRDDVNEDEWKFLLTGGIALDNIHKNPASEWLSNKSWAEIVRCSNMAAFEGLKEDFEKEVKVVLLHNLS